MIQATFRSVLIGHFCVAGSVAFSANEERLSLVIAVVDEAGMPAASVTVRSQANLRFPSKTATTDNGGRATLQLAPEEASGLALVADDGTNMGYAQLPWSQTPSNELETVTLTLSPARQMKVRVVDESGEPVTGAKIVVQSTYREAARAASDDNGVATIRLPSDAPRMAIMGLKKSVGFDYHSFVPAGAPQTKPSLLPQDYDEPIELVLNGARAVVVEVVDQDGEPLSGVRVYPWLFRKPNKGEDINLSGLTDFKFETDDNGQCTFDVPIDLDRATTVWTNLDGYAAPDRANFDPKSVDSTVRATMEKMVKLSGTVELPTGVFADDIRVAVVGEGHSFDGFRRTEVALENDGSFELLVNRNMYYQLVASDNQQWASPPVNAIVLNEDVDDVELSLGPATRVYGRMTVEETDDPVPDKYLYLYQRTAASYYDLPDEEKIPNPQDSNRAISPVVVKSDQTDADGQFEFFVGPGSYYMHGPRTAEMPRFEIGNESEKELTIQVKSVEMRKNNIVPGRVVVADGPSQTIANARVFSYPLESFSGQHIDATTNHAGEFEARQILSRHLIHATAIVDGQSYAGVVEIGPDDEEYVVPIGPSGSLRGVLKAEELDLPLENRRVRCSIRIEYPDGTSTAAFGGSATTDENGAFVIDHLIPGRSYTVTVVTEIGSDGFGRSWGTAGEVTLDQPSELVRVFSVSALDFPPTFAPITE